MNGLEFGVIIFFALVVIGFVTGGSHRKMRKNDEARMAREMADREHLEAALERERKKERARLMELREARRESIIRRNENCMKLNGRIWEDEDEAMLDYDTRFRKKWEAVGMTPPSFVKDADHK